MNEELTKPEIFHMDFNFPDLNKWLFEFKDEMATSFCHHLLSQAAHICQASTVWQPMADVQVE